MALDSRGLVKLSYFALHRYRTRLMSEVDKVLKTQDIRGPRQLGDRLKQLKVLPSEDEAASDPILAEFLRSILLSGNGTLLINNTFVEWATIQAVRRARPSVVLVSFGIRNKIKPFSSLLIYTEQETTTPVPTQMDTLGSYVDLEVLTITSGWNSKNIPSTAATRCTTSWEKDWMKCCCWRLPIFRC